MIDVKQAIANARSYAQEILGAPEFLLEEVHSRPDRFEVTLSFPERTNVRNMGLVLSRGPREYKTFEVSKDSGEVLGMSIRQIA